MKEKDFQTVFARENTKLGAFELKLVKGDRLPFSALAEHQYDSLMAVYNGKLFHKLTDVPVSKMQEAGKKGMRFTRRKPFDCFLIGNFPAYVVVGFYRRKGWFDVVYIPIELWESIATSTDKKSITLRELYSFVPMDSLASWKTTKPKEDE